MSDPILHDAPPDQISLLDRLKKRYETDIDDPELQRLIDKNQAEIIRLFGPHADPDDPITVTVPGGGRTIQLLRPIDPAQEIVVTEHYRTWAWGEPRTAILTTDQYRVWHDGRTLERVYGPNAGDWWSGTWGRTAAPEDTFGWGGTTGWTEITYVPVNDGDQRQEAILKLTILDLEYDPVTRSRVGLIDRFPLEHEEARQKLLQLLAPAGGMTIA